LVLVADGVLVVFAMLLAYGAHASLRVYSPLLREPPPLEDYAGLVVAALPLWLVLIASLGLHRVVERVWTRAAMLLELGKLHLAGLVGLSVILFLTKGQINRSMVALFLLSSFLLLYLERGLLSRWLAYQHRRGLGRHRLLLVGPWLAPMRAFAESASRTAFPPELVGRLGSDASGSSEAPGPEATTEPLPRLGSLRDLEQALHEHPIDRVLFFPPLHHPDELAEALGICETHGVVASFALELSTPHRAAPRLERLGEREFVSYDVAPKNAALLAVKHGVDLVAAALGLVALAPLLGLTALAIWVTMGRPILYVQERAGLRGRPFKMLKFRSMAKGAEAQRAALQGANETGGPTFKMTADPRITRLGRLLRRTSIDELPQLFNVLTGAMSLVGPRPLPLDEQQRIRGWHRRRLSMKPGLTCIWQVSGRSEIGFEEWMEMDLRYVDAWSLWGDVALVAKTLPVILNGRGAK
jgi:exopolysaccharide biosynthesis polyprenyl glycosylphosphotransferase